MSKWILAGDIGGTKVNLALCEVEGQRVIANRVLRYPSRRFQSLKELLEQYFADLEGLGAGSVGELKKRISGAGFGVPGPVEEDRCLTVNLPWVIDVREARQVLGGGATVRLLNDLEAMGNGIEALTAAGTGLFTLRKGQAVATNQALLAPGTGLGEALIFVRKGLRLVSASEGGHCDFGPQDDEQVELLRWLWPRHSHVSWEHVASGPAIYRIYRFLRDTGREQAAPDIEAEFGADGAAAGSADSPKDPVPFITAHALKGDSPICTRTLDLWMFLVGAEAGNLVLKSMCHGGLFLGGGVVPKIIDLFRKPAFFSGLESKGRMSGIIKDVPIHVVMDEHTALYGAALAAGGLSK